MLRKTWDAISSIGIREEYDDILVKRITLTNQFSVVAIFVFVFSGINNYVLGDLYSALLIEGLVVVTLGAFPEPQYVLPGAHDRRNEVVAFTRAVRAT